MKGNLTSHKTRSSARPAFVDSFQYHTQIDSRFLQAIIVLPGRTPIVSSMSEPSKILYTVPGYILAQLMQIVEVFRQVPSWTSQILHRTSRRRHRGWDSQGLDGLCLVSPVNNAQENLHESCRLLRDEMSQLEGMR